MSEIPQTAEGILDLTGVQGDRDGVHGEVAACEVGRDRIALDLGDVQRMLSGDPKHARSRPTAGNEDGRPEAMPLELLRNALRVARDRDVDLRNRLPEQGVPHGAPDDPGSVSALTREARER